MENEKCFRCRHFMRYYTKGVKQFNMTKIGWCCGQQKIVQIQGSCEKYVLKQHSKKSNKLLRYYLDGLLTEISVIRMIVEEESQADEKPL